MLDRYHLRYFLAVVETGNFTRAAARVNVTQPTLSTGVAKLEAAVGDKLFFRNSQRVQLTEAGNRLLPHAREIERSFHAIEGAPTSDRGGRLRLGVLSTVPIRLIEQLVDRRRRAGAVARLEIIEGADRELIAKLDRGRIDLALTLKRERPERFDFQPLMTETYCLAVPTGHRLAGMESIDGETLGEEVMIVRRHCEALADISRYFTSRAVRPEFSLRSQNDERVMAMVRAGLGITVMPESYRDSDVAQVRLTGLDLQRTLGVLTAAPITDPAMATLVDDLASLLQAF